MRREALSILSQKKQGGYVILQMNSDYEPPSVQTRDVFGVTLEEARMKRRLDQSALKKTSSQGTQGTAAARRDALVALITLKYTQSNSVCLGYRWSNHRIGAGQQSRIHCTRIACAKADLCISVNIQPQLDYHSGLDLRPARTGNGIDLYLREM